MIKTCLFSSEKKTELIFENNLDFKLILILETNIPNGFLSWDNLEIIYNVQIWNMDIGTVRSGYVHESYYINSPL